MTYSIFTWFSKRAQRRQSAHDLYGSIVAMAREPELYTRYCVPDTLEKRFELLVLHMFVLLNHLNQSNSEAGPLRQLLVDQFFSDVETITRQQGAGDMAVPRKMRSIAATFAERMETYKTAIRASKSAGLPKTFEEIFFEESDQKVSHASALAGYIIQLSSALAEISSKKQVPQPNELAIARRAALG